MCEKVEIRYEWTCPHCGYRNFGLATVRDRYGSLSAALVYCDIDEGGCDRMVAVKSRLCVKTEVYALVGTETEHYPQVDAELDAEERKAEAKKWQSAYEDGYAAGLYDAAEIAAETAELEQAAAMDENGDPLAPADDDNELLTIAYGVGFERGKQVNAPVDDTPRLVTNSAPEPVDPELFASAGDESANLVVGNPYYAEGNEEVVSKWPQPPSNGHVPVLSTQAAATLGTEHTINTPLDKPIGRARDPLPDPDVARDKLAAAVAQGGNGAVSRLASTVKPRSLAEVDAELDAKVAAVWGDDDDDTDDDAPPVKERSIARDIQLQKIKQQRKQTRTVPKHTVLPTKEQLIKEVRRQSMGGTMPTQAQFDLAKPATWATSQAHSKRFNLTWGQLAEEAGLKLKRPK